MVSPSKSPSFIRAPALRPNGLPTRSIIPKEMSSPDISPSKAISSWTSPWWRRGANPDKSPSPFWNRGKTSPTKARRKLSANEVHIDLPPTARSRASTVGTNVLQQQARRLVKEVKQLTRAKKAGTKEQKEAAKAKRAVAAEEHRQWFAQQRRLGQAQREKEDLNTAMLMQGLWVADTQQVIVHHAADGKAASAANAAAHRPRDRDERSGHPAVPEALFMAPPGVAAEATSQAAQMAKRAGSSKAGSSKAGSAKRAPARKAAAKSATSPSGFFDNLFGRK